MSFYDKRILHYRMLGKDLPKIVRRAVLPYPHHISRARSLRRSSHFGKSPSAPLFHGQVSDQKLLDKIHWRDVRFDDVWLHEQEFSFHSRHIPLYLSIFLQFSSNWLSLFLSF